MPSWGIRWVVPVLLLIASAAEAGSLYRCKGAQGEVAFTSSRAGYSECTVIRTAPDPAPAKSAASTEAKPRVEFRSAPGAQAPTSSDPAAVADRTTRGAVYRYVKDGVTHYTNRQPAGVRATVVFTYMESCFACAVRPGLDFHSVRLNTEAFSEEVIAAAGRHDIDPAFVRAVIHAESAFNPMAVSNKGAQGLMQLMPATAAQYQVRDPYDPATNLEAGVRHLKGLLGRFDLALALAAYNAGEGTVRRHGGIPPYPETRAYVGRVLALLPAGAF